jgi:hypothetical protein
MAPGTARTQSAICTAAEREYSKATVLVAGLVTGDIGCRPASIDIVGLTEGAAADQEAVLAAKDARQFDRATVVSSSPWVTAAIAPPKPTRSGGTRGPATRTLIVTVTPEAQPGLWHAVVTVATTSGVRLNIPVSFDVAPDGGG